MKQMLVVDDEEWICSVLQDYFEDCGFKVSTAYNLTNARKFLKSNPLPDVLVLDVMLPDGNGMNYVTELRSDPQTRILPIVLMSAHATQVQDRIHGLGNGADEYMTKPFDLRELRARIEALLRRVDQFKEEEKP